MNTEITDQKRTDELNSFFCLDPCHLCESVVIFLKRSQIFTFQRAHQLTNLYPRLTLS